jgi:hypothetical protein
MKSYLKSFGSTLRNNYHDTKEHILQPITRLLFSLKQIQAWFLSIRRYAHKAKIAQIFILVSVSQMKIT